MIYRVIGVMSGSSLDGLDIAYVHLEENAGNWQYEIKHADCYSYDEKLTSRLQYATTLPALDYQLLHAEFGHHIGKEVRRFIIHHDLDHQVHLISSHGHTTFHLPAQGMTGQLGDGSAIAAETGLVVISDLRAMDVALGGQGAPIVPIGERILLQPYQLFMNLGGIANISVNAPGNYIAFDVCAANRVLNMLSNREGQPYDEDGRLAASGAMDDDVLRQLNDLPYYSEPYPKSLANDFGVEIVFPLMEKLPGRDALRTYVEHIAIQVQRSLVYAFEKESFANDANKILITGGGALNSFLVERIAHHLGKSGIVAEVPDHLLINYKEALIMALIGTLRWREEPTVISTVTGAKRNSIGGAMWIGASA